MTLSPAAALGLPHLPPTLTVAQAATLMGVSRQTVYRAHQAGEIPGLKVRSRLVIPTAPLLDALGLAAEDDSVPLTHPAPAPMDEEG